jgi:hypothetical protein
MRVFEFYIEDDRYTVPTLCFMQATDQAHALELAEYLLAQSSSHLGVEVCDEGAQRLFGIGSNLIEVRRSGSRTEP